MKHCFHCGRYTYTERHHVFGGANRRLSEEDGLVVNLCHACHNEPPNGVHFNKAFMDALHVWGQDTWELQKVIKEHITREQARKEFMKRYGRNYL